MSKVKTSQVEKVILCEPRGFCAGVEMAIKALSWMTKLFEPPIYCYHEIVHNKLVVDQFKKLGVIFVNDISEIPEGSPIMLSAHGSAPEVVKKAEDTGSYVINAVCPLVTKVHHEVKTKSNKGYQIIYVGHAGHEEAVGTMAVSPNNIHRVETTEEVEQLPQFDSPTALLAQTTLSHRDWKKVADTAEERFPDIFTPEKSDLCFATTNRQSALLAISKHCDSIVVIGSANSSNTNALAKLAKESGCENVYRINNQDELPDDLTGIVGVTAGASAPEYIVEAVIEKLAPKNGVEVAKITEEDEYFPPPRRLRNVLDSLESTISLALGGTSKPKTLLDKQVTATSILNQNSAS